MRTAMCAALAALLLSGCGGGSSMAPAPGSSVQTDTGTMSSVESTIVVPSAQTTQRSGQRSAQYISASTLGLKVTVTDVPPAGKTASFTATTSVYALAIGLNKIIIPTPASAAGHTEDLTYVAYNLAPVANVIPANAKALAWGLTAGFVVVAGANTNNVTLSAVADTFGAPVVENGSFGMMSAAPPTLAGAQTSLGFGGAAVPAGAAVLFDGGGNNIGAAAGGPWSVVGSVPATVSTAATGVPVTIAESAGVAGCSVGSGPHLKIATNGGAPATSATIATPGDAIQAQYDGNGGVGWFAVITAKAQSQSLTYTLSSLGVTSPSADFSCASQTLSFSGSAGETATMTISQHTAAAPYVVTVPNVAGCTQLVNVYVGTGILGAVIVPGTPTSLGVGTTFTIQVIPVPAGPTTCNIQIQDANVASTGGALFPGATTYVAASLPPGAYSIIVP